MITPIIKIKFTPDEINLFIFLEIRFISIFFLKGHKRTIANAVIIFEYLIFIVFSFGNTEDKIINIIKIPPVNKIKKISGIHTILVLDLTMKSIIPAEVKIKNLAFIGLFEFVITQILEIIKMGIT